MSEATLLPGQVGVNHDLEISVPCVLRGRSLETREVLTRANQVDHAVEAATGVSSWASGMGFGNRDISFRFETTKQLVDGVEAAERVLTEMGYLVERIDISSAPSSDDDGDDDDGTACLAIERNIPVDAHGDRVEVDD